LNFVLLCCYRRGVFISSHYLTYVCPFPEDFDEICLHESFECGPRGSLVALRPAGLKLQLSVQVTANINNLGLRRSRRRYTRRRNDDHENVRLDIERSINQSLYHYFIACPNADFTNGPLSLSQVEITGHVK